MYFKDLSNSASWLLTYSMLYLAIHTVIFSYTYSFYVICIKHFFYVFFVVMIIIILLLIFFFEEEQLIMFRKALFNLQITTHFSFILFGIFMILGVNIFNPKIHLKFISMCCVRQDDYFQKIYFKSSQLNIWLFFTH